MTEIDDQAGRTKNLPPAMRAFFFATSAAAVTEALREVSALPPVERRADAERYWTLPAAAWKRHDLEKPLYHHVAIHAIPVAPRTASEVSSVFDP